MSDPIKCILYCILYYVFIGVSGFMLGRIMPKSVFHGDRFPFRPFRWEKQGAVYNRLGIRWWKEKVPDMSVILPKLMPSKKMPKDVTAAGLELMVQETCVAEWIHGLLCALGFGCVFIWKGVWGWIVSVLYLLGNLPDIIIQRYNRPKLMRILQRVREKESAYEKCDHLERQYGTRS